jgi:hypothetical protein
MSVFPLSTDEVLRNIAANPNPRRWAWPVPQLRACVTWGKHHRLLIDFASLDRAAAVDSIRNVLAVLGAGTVLGDFATMRLWMALPCALVALTIWYADYLRHF